VCRIDYHHNFFVKDKQRVYYDAMPDIIQAGEHQFVERKVIEQWIHQMLVAWTSATNCARLYSMSFSQEKFSDKSWPFGCTLTSDHVWDAVIILSLLQDCARRQETLVVPNTGLQKDRHVGAIRARNQRMRLYGQPELRHFCHKCV